MNHIYIYTLKKTENYCVLLKYHKYVFPHLTLMMGPTNKIHGGTHQLFEGREYEFMVLRKYLIIFQKRLVKLQLDFL